MKLARFLCVMYGCFFVVPYVTASSKDDEIAVEAIKVAEELRSAENTEMEIELKNSTKTTSIQYTMKIMRGSGKRALVDFLSPKEDFGRKLLAIKNSYWATFPDSKRVHNISRREMIGNSAFAVADLFQMDIKEDFKVKFLRREACGAVECIVVQLDARHDEAAYENIIYTIELKDYFPNKAQFYGASGKLIKSMSIGERQTYAGRLRPKMLVMKDELIKDRESVWITKTMVSKKIPNSVFSTQYLASQL